MFRTELIEIMEGMTAKNLTLINEKLDAASRDSSAKLGKLDDRLQLLEEKAAAATTITMVMKLLHKQGCLAQEWKQTAPDIRLAEVKMSVITVILTELKFSFTI